MGLTVILALIGQLAPLLSKFIGTGWTGLIGSTTTAIGALWGAFTSGGTITSELQAAITAMQAEAVAVMSAEGASAEEKAIAAEIADIALDALKGYSDAASGAVDPGTLPVPPAVQ